MPVVMIGNFGKDDEGVHTYRINATTKDDLHTLIDECRKSGWRFWDTPNILKAHGRTWTVLLKLYQPKQMGYPEESSGANGDL
jgi:hypothetical protein